MNYARARDWEVYENAKKGIVEAIAEAERRGITVHRKFTDAEAAARWEKIVQAAKGIL